MRGVRLRGVFGFGMRIWTHRLTRSIRAKVAICKLINYRYNHERNKTESKDNYYTRRGRRAEFIPFQDHSDRPTFDLIVRVLVYQSLI